MLLSYAVVGIIAFPVAWRVTIDYPCFEKDFIEPFGALSSLLFFVVTMEGGNEVVAFTGSVLSAGSLMLHATDGEDARTIDHAFSILVVVVIFVTFSNIPRRRSTTVLSVLGFVTIIVATDAPTSWVYVLFGVVLFMFVMTWHILRQYDKLFDIRTGVAMVIAAVCAVATKYGPSTEFCDVKRDVVHSIWHVLTSTAIWFLIRLLNNTTPEGGPIKNMEMVATYSAGDNSMLTSHHITGSQWWEVGIVCIYAIFSVVGTYVDQIGYEWMAGGTIAYFCALLAICSAPTIKNLWSSSATQYTKMSSPPVV